MPELNTEMLGASLAAVYASEAEWDRLNQQVEENEHAAAIRTASSCIERHERFLGEYRAEVALLPMTAEAHGRNLVTFYGVRGTQRLILADQGGAEREKLLNLAEADIEKALSYPPGCYKDPDARANLEEAHKLIQSVRHSSGSSGSSKSSGCLGILLLAFAIATVLGLSVMF